MTIKIVHCKKEPYDVYIGRGDVLKDLVNGNDIITL